MDSEVLCFLASERLEKGINLRKAIGRESLNMICIKKVKETAENGYAEISALRFI